MSESSHRTAIVVAVIGVFGSLGAALIGNWENIFAPSPQPSPRSNSSKLPETKLSPQRKTILNIDGIWRDSNYPSNGSEITQNGNNFSFTRWGVLPNGIRFESSGSGKITGQNFTSNYRARYESGATSAGDCSGTLSLDGMRMKLNCRDSALGVFPVTAIRQ